MFVPQGSKVNTSSYTEVILTPALQEVEKHFKDRPFTFHQDGALSHTSENKNKSGVRTTFLVSGARNFSHTRHET